MIAEFDRDLILTIKAESELEEYALAQWIQLVNRPAVIKARIDSSNVSSVTYRRFDTYRRFEED